MSSKVFCDLCHKELLNIRHKIRLSVLADITFYDYCRECFLDRKNWSKIYRVAGKSMEAKLDRLTELNKKPKLKI